MKVYVGCLLHAVAYDIFRKYKDDTCPVRVELYYDEGDDDACLVITKEEAFAFVIDKVEIHEPYMLVKGHGKDNEPCKVVISLNAKYGEDAVLARMNFNRYIAQRQYLEQRARQVCDMINEGRKQRKKGKTNEN